MLLNGIFKCTTEGFPTAGLGRLGYGNTAVSLVICKKIISTIPNSKRQINLVF